MANYAPIGVGLLGMGVVGRGVAEYLMHEGDSKGLRLKGVAVMHPEKNRNISVPRLTGDAYSLIDDPDVKIIVEAVGGEHPALEYQMAALERGKAVVTPNKLVVARHMPQLFKTAQEKGVDYRFEGAAGGAIPIVNALLEDLAANDIHGIRCVVNGTTNYILTQMGKYRVQLAKALRKAQEKGYAERDPKSDVSGEDAKYKISILASLAWNTWIDPSSIQHKGVEGITPQDFYYANLFNYTPKLLAEAALHNGKGTVWVGPTLVPRDHELAQVDGVFNAIQVEGSLCDRLTWYGRGAGSKPTASAVLSDVRRVAQNLRRNVHDDLPSLDRGVQLAEDPVSEGYIRAGLDNRAGTWARVSRLFGDNGISIGSTLQWKKFDYKDGDTVVAPNIILIESTRDSVRNRLLEELGASDDIHGRPFYMRIVDA